MKFIGWLIITFGGIGVALLAIKLAYGSVDSGFVAGSMAGATAGLGGLYLYES